MKDTLVSFVIPVHNGEAYLAETINSVINQSLRSIEVIVVNDRSTDGTEDLVKFYQSKDSRVVLAPPHTGKTAGAARNNGNRIARAPVICVLDGDDLADKYRAKESYDFFKDRKFKPAYFYGSAAILDFVSREIARVSAEPFNFELAMEEKTNRIVHSTVAYTKETAMQFPYDEGKLSANGMEDWHQQIRLFKADVPLIHTPKILSAYRSHSTSLTKDRNEDRMRKIKTECLKEMGVLHG